MKTIKEIKNEISKTKAGSAWEKGVKLYAIEILNRITEDNGDDYTPDTIDALKKDLLNGADNWELYSESGRTLEYNEDICNRLCSPTEKIKRANGRYNPNKQETWLDVQARALKQAERLIISKF